VEEKKKTPTISTKIVAECGTFLMFSSVESLLKQIAEKCRIFLVLARSYPRPLERIQAAG